MDKQQQQQQQIIKDYNTELQRMNKLQTNTKSWLDRNKELKESLDKLKKIINRLIMSMTTTTTATSGDDTTRNLLVEDYYERLRVIETLYFDSINHTAKKSKEEVDSLLYLLKLGVNGDTSSSSSSLR